MTQSQSGPGSNGNEGGTEFSKVPGMERDHQADKCKIKDTRWVWFLPLCRDEVGVFYCPADWIQPL